MKLDHVLAALRDGAVLHHNLADKSPPWKLHTGTTVVTVSGRTVQAAIKRGVIEGSGDSLLADVPSQTWKWCGD